MLREKIDRLIQTNQDLTEQIHLYGELDPQTSDAARDFRAAMVQAADHQRMTQVMDLNSNHLRTGNAHDEWGE